VCTALPCASCQTLHSPPHLAPPCPPLRAFYKVPFEEVSELIAHRRVLLRHGFAYVNSQQLDSVVVMKFRAELSKVSGTYWRAGGMTG
jgi:hypothetical protein